MALRVENYLHATAFRNDIWANDMLVVKASKDSSETDAGPMQTSQQAQWVGHEVFRAKQVPERGLRQRTVHAQR